MTALKIPLVLVSGFLGAGKTTFLRQLLPALGKAGLRPSLIINDYGEAEIDAATLAHLSASVRAINGSCVCCESQEEFLDLLAREQMDGSSVLLVETNGTTDPYEVIEAIGLDDRARRFGAPLHVAVIDIQRWQKRWWHNALERLQVKSASHVWLSKTDLVSHSRREEVLASLRMVNAHAETLVAKTLAEVIPKLLTFAREAAPHVRQSLANPHDPAAHHHHDHAHDFVSMQISLPFEISRARMTAWLTTLPREVVRAKGFVRLAEAADRLHSFQKVEDAIEITFLPLDAKFAREPLALLIGSGLNRDLIPPL